eukprot:scaffold13576_cov179-Ochromonas_danica.AAC.5
MNGIEAKEAIVDKIQFSLTEEALKKELQFRPTQRDLTNFKLKEEDGKNEPLKVRFYDANIASGNKTIEYTKSNFDNFANLFAQHLSWTRQRDAKRNDPKDNVCVALVVIDSDVYITTNDHETQDTIYRPIGPQYDDIYSLTADKMADMLKKNQPSFKECFTCLSKWASEMSHETGEVSSEMSIEAGEILRKTAEVSSEMSKEAGEVLHKTSEVSSEMSHETGVLLHETGEASSEKLYEILYETGEVLHKTGGVSNEMLHKIGQVLHQTGEVSKEIVHKTGDVLHVTGVVLHKTGEVSGEVLHKTAEVLHKTGE